MSSSNNPKTFYNQSDYSNTMPDQQTHRKPDVASSLDLAPPPPYTTSRPNADADPEYGSFRDTSNSSRQEEQTGLLGNSSTAAPLRNSKPNWSERSQRGMAYENRNSRRSGCCQGWCGDFVCLGPSDTWNDLPDMIDFKDNIEVRIEGFVSGGRILITPGEQRHEGKIWTQVQLSPYLKSEINYSIERPQDDFTRLVLRMPRRMQHEGDCINIQLQVDLPYGASLARFSTSNMEIEIDQPFKKEVETLDLRTSNGNILLDHWAGERLSAKTTNGNIKVKGSLSSGNFIHLETTNGQVTFFDTVTAKEMLQVINTNGGIEALELLKTDHSIQLRTTNGLIEASKMIAPIISINNSNGKILADDVEAETNLVAKTTNSLIRTTVKGDKNIHVDLVTTNAPIQLHMTNEFEGYFTFSTSHSEKVTVEDDSEITYVENLKNFKRGYRKGTGNKGDLLAKTSNADIKVSFDV